MFEDVHVGRVTGELAMYDRLIFKGHLTRLFNQDAVRAYLWSQGVGLKEFTPYAKATTARIADHCRGLAAAAGRPVISFDHVKTRGRPSFHKDDLAKSIVERDGITRGIVCLISAVESCMSFQVRKRVATGKMEIFRRERACLHHWLYLIDPEFGFMHVRIQGWLPYQVQVYINGREWLALQLDKAGIDYVRYENSLPWIANLHKASELCERFGHKAWPRVLNAFAKLVNPLLARVVSLGFGGYYWVTDQAEIATDLMFKSRPHLLSVWPDLVHIAEDDLRERLAVLAEYQQRRHQHIDYISAQLKEIITTLAQVDAALDCSRTDRVAGLADDPPEHLLARIGGVPDTPAGRAVWCHHPLNVEAVLDRNDGSPPAWAGWSQQTDRARHQDHHR
jgi:hypothetical protein